MLRRSFAWLLTLALGWAPQLFAQAPLPGPSDGPQVLWRGTEATVHRLRDGKVETQRRKGAFDLALPGLAAAPLRLDPAPPVAPATRFPLPVKILAVSDIHGRFDTLLALLKAHGVVDEGLRWRFGPGHLVIVGDVMDRGPQVTEAYWFLRGLEVAAQRAGGRVHVLLGNHEAMVLLGDVRYVNPKYLNPPDGWPALAAVHGPDSELGRWLRVRPALVALGPFLFVHGGLAPEFQAAKRSLEQVNQEVRSALAQGGSRPAILAGGGPLWYRGLLPEGGRPQAEDGAIQAILDAFEAKAFIVGHTTLDRVGVFHGGRVYGIDAGIKDGRPGEAWLWEQGRAWRAKADGSREALVP